MIIYDIKPPKKIRTKQILKPKISESGFVSIPKIYKSVFHRSFSFLLIFCLIFGNFLFEIKIAGAVETTYYVDNCDVIGNDTNNGTSVSTPWLTINKVNTSSFVAGDTISFRKGCTWREQLTVPSSGSAGSPITFNAYGATGANPIISGSDLVTSWSLAQQALTTYITDGLDDADDYGPGGLENTGDMVWMSHDTLTMTTGFRFQNITIPKSTTITSATFQPYIYASPNITTTIYGEAADNSINFDNANPYPNARVTTTANTPWTSTATGRVSVSVTSQVQEIINLTNWASGHALTILSKPGSATTLGNVCAYEDCAPDHSQVAKLVITYPLGNASIYQSSVAWTPRDVYRNNLLLTKENSLGALTADGQWYYDSGAQLLYIYSTANPSSDTIDATHSDNTVYINGKNYLTLSNLHIIHGHDNNLRINASHDITVFNSELDYSSGVGVNIGAGSYNLLFDGGSLHNSGFSFGDGDGFAIGNSTDASHDITIQNMDIYANGNSTSGSNIGIGVTDTGQLAYNILIQHNSIRDASYFCGISSSASAASLVISDNVIKNNPFCGVQTYNTVAATTMAVYLYNNTIVGNGSASGYGVAFASVLGTTQVTLKNNIIWGNVAGTFGEVQWQTGDPGTLTLVASDYNDVYDTLGGGPFYYSGFKTLAAWRTATSQDAHSISADPKFTNAGTGDFSLLSTSPAIDSGVSLGDTYKLGLNPNSVWPSAVNTLDQTLNGLGWEIGAYVFSIPTASAVSLSGTETVGSTLTGTYSYSDLGGAAQGVSTFRWLRSDTLGGTYTAIGSATALTHVLTSADIGKYIKFEVTPVSTLATGSAVLSSASGQIQSSGVPTASAVSISGTVTEGLTLTGNYTYAQTDSVDQGVSTFRWLRATTAGGSYSAIVGATANTYALAPADVGKYIKFEVTPVASFPPTTGSATLSSNVGPIVASNLPVASAVSIGGTETIGSTLTGSYTYTDSGSHAESGSTFRWLRASTSNGSYSAISSATSLTYALVSADIGQYVKFEVTPISTVATGVAVASNPSGQINSSAVPTASSVTVSGTADVGQVLTGSYIYAQADSVAEGATTFRWLESGTVGGTYSAITGATNSTYTVVTANQGMYIKFEVTPIAAIPPTTGVATLSSATAQVPLPVSTPAPVVSSGGGGGGCSSCYNLPTVPTGGFKITINQNASTTSNRIVTLNSTAGTDVKKMAISMTGDFADSSQEDYQATKQWDLCSKFGGLVKSSACSDGTYKVYAKFYTSYGVASPIASSSIVLKTDTVSNSNPDSVQPTTPVQQNSNSFNFTKTLQFGSNNNEVKELQNFLKQLGFFPQDTVANGNFGPATKQAVMEYQKSVGLYPEGVVGSRTRKALNNQEFVTNKDYQFINDLKYGDAGEEVKQLQTRLRDRSFFPYWVSSTGWFGPVTKNSVKLFQKFYSLFQSGDVNEETRNKLNQ